MTEPLLEIGAVVGTHGLRGDLKIHLNSGDPDLLMTLKQVFLRLPSGDLQRVAITRQVLHKGRVLLRLQGYESIDLAEPIVGSQVLLAEDSLPRLGDCEYYWGQLDGLQVVDQTRGEIGTLRDLLSTAAHDTYVVRGHLGEILIPAVRQFVLAVDLETGIMQVDLPDGLLPEQL
ncbi:16S rRNA processing protein RimM [Desulfuromusa kysingii]|uniref:Ribosome maturation factor RimM n=1 Tax=Desulfuromusa kysingii TaxID=37625 RepID=A0A1H3ZJK0_9BACT|nr:ribosome maturation factor RimM [Desulfuromusa kysingii]SEA23837.1 16S rRNA processing protein RimM [Desulfuromusa kysingii]